MHQGRLSPLDGGSKSHYTSTTHFIDPAQTSLSLPPPILKPSPLCFSSYAPLLSSYSCPNLSLLFPPLLAGVRGHSRTGCDLWLKLVGGSNVTERYSFPLAAKRPHLRLRCLGERLSFPSLSGRSPAAKRILLHLEL
jgi:hypothetical protein